MQSLYAYFSSKEDDIFIAEEKMLKHIQEVRELYLVIISLIIELVRYSDDFFERSKKKHFPTEDDLNPSRRFIDNKIINLIRKNKDLMDEIDNISSIWLNNDHDIISKLFKKLYSSDLYKAYISNEDMSIEVDQRFIANALHDCILNNELVHHIFEERSIYWLDDLPFVVAVILGDIKSKNDMFLKTVFKNSSDKRFAIQLLRNTINNNQEYEKIIIRFAKNWELDRIAIMDQLFLKMAFAEILTMEELPVKVSMNEYIEIAKYYSTSKSKLFVNGLLDAAVKNFQLEGVIKKTGRGLNE